MYTDSENTLPEMTSLQRDFIHYLDFSRLFNYIILWFPNFESAHTELQTSVSFTVNLWQSKHFAQLISI